MKISDQKTVLDSDWLCLNIKEEARVIKFGPDERLEGCVVSNDRLHHSAEGTDEGIKVHGYGRTTEGEENVETVARTFCEYLRSLNDARTVEYELRTVPQTPDELGIDFVVKINGTENECQVTRPPCEDYWPQLGKGAEVNAVASPSELAEELAKAVGKKAKRSAPEDRGRLMILIDAGESTGVLLEPVREAFRRSFADAVRRFGFAAVYVVGPNARCVFRLV